MPLKGLIFDFDGLILETEVPGFTAWQEKFILHGYSFTHEDWKKAIGTGPTAYDPGEHLSQLTNRRLDPQILRDEVIFRSNQILSSQPILPVVLDFIHTAKGAGLVLAIASSSNRSWVNGHLARLGLMKFFKTVCTADDVSAVKPDPELYLLALTNIGLSASEVIAFEDSPNGISAAKAAGIYCIAIPNEITRSMNISDADRIVHSFLDLTLDGLILGHRIRCEMIYNCGYNKAKKHDQF
jgi:HAD superfamily hydrolase (TIGR01509 family)